MGSPRITRRGVLQKCLALGSLTILSSTSATELIAAWDEREKLVRTPTPWNELGPFYKKRAPQTASLRALEDPGMPLSVSGQVFDVRGEVVSGAKVEVWQTDHLGHYDLDGYRYRATLISDTNGKYSFDSVMPGHYPDRVCQHVHYLVTAPGHKPITTQLYFATDPVFEGDPDRNYKRDPLLLSRELVRPVVLRGDPKNVFADVTFELVMERL
jgi:protocatechuate 3,4-dioxygenase beta subunit